MPDVPAKDRQNAQSFCRLLCKEGKGANDLQPYLPPLTVGQGADEEALVRINPLGVIVGELLQEIQGTLGDERVLVPGEGGHVGQALRS